MNVAFIPVRGGSKSIPLKNIRPICGKPLVYWTVKAACGCHFIDRVYVATDSPVIRETVESFKTGREARLFAKATVIGRSPATATDTASTESAMLEFAENYAFDNIVLIQATSPLLCGADLDAGFRAFETEGTDSVLSVVRQKRFQWQTDADGFAHTVNYDVFHRPRRQEFDGCLIENGAFYITSKAGLLKSRNRVSGKIRAVEMSEDTFFEIDEPADWVMIQALMKKNGRQEELEMPEIKMLLTDCDGCLTDSGMYYTEFGDEIKKFNTRDGVAFALLRKQGILTGMVTSENVKLNRRRAEKLKLDILEPGAEDKAAAVRKLAERYQVPLQNIAFVGDEINDLEVLKIVGLACCPADAHPSVKAAARLITKAKGGEGVIREVAEKILQER